MTMRTYRHSLGLLAATSVFALAMGSGMAADEPPANDSKQPPLPSTINLAPLIYAAEGVGANTGFALREISLAVNTDLIGVDVAQVDDVLRSHLGLPEGKGLIVTGVGDDSPAAKAGLQKNDVLTAVGGEEIASLEGFRKSLEAAAETPIAIGFIRAGKKQSVEVTPLSPTVPLALSVNFQPAGSKYWLGVGLAAADDTLRSQLSIAAGEGLVVTSVEGDSPAVKSGVMVNDVLLKLDGKPLTAIEALTEQIQTIADKSVSLELLRRGKPAALTVTPEKHAEPLWTTASALIASQNTYSANGVFPYPLAVFQPQPRPDLATQVNSLLNQTKQLQASLEALRAAIEPPAQPAQNVEEKK